MRCSITTKTIARINELHNAGMVDREIAEALGLPHARVHYWRNKMGLAPNRGKERYTVYDRETSGFIVEGTARECCAFLGIKKASFWHAVCCFRKGRGGKYEIYEVEEETA